jgi:hypothetical protein
MVQTGGYRLKRLGGRTLSVQGFTPGSETVYPG